MGELHDNPTHHLNQAMWIAELRPSAVVFEQLTPALALAATRMRGAPAETLGAALEWEARGWPDFAMYHPIFVAARKAAIFGGNVGEGDISVALASGAAAALGAAAPVFGLDDPLPADELAARLDDIAVAHCGLMPTDALGNMVEAQRLRDAALARAVIAAWEETGGPIAVITGNGHARRDWGVPALLARARPELRVVALGQLAGPAEAPPFDAWVVAPYPPGAGDGDPCDALR